MADFTHRSGQIEVRRSRGRLVVNGLGKTPRGQKFIAQQVKLESTSMDDPEFKDEMAAAVEEILGKKA